MVKTILVSGHFSQSLTQRQENYLALTALTLHSECSSCAMLSHKDKRSRDMALLNDTAVANGKSMPLALLPHLELWSNRSA